MVPRMNLEFQPSWSTTLSSEHRAFALFLPACYMMLLLLAIPAGAQCPGRWLPGADVAGVNGPVWALMTLPDGDLLVGGVFSAVGGTLANDIARYNPTTGTWSAVGTGPTGGASGPVIFTFALLPSGDVLVGGGFSAVNGVPAMNIALYNPTSGAWSAVGGGISGGTNLTSVRAIAVLPSGDAIVGGIFSSAGGSSAINIARVNPAKGTWSSLGPGVTGSFPVVAALVALPSGDVVLAGDFSSAGNITASSIARYSPTSNSWFGLGSGVRETSGNTTWPMVQALAVLPDGDVVAGGDFDIAGAAFANNIARYSLSSDSWTAFDQGATGAGEAVSALVVLPGGDIVAGGSFQTAGGQPINRIVRYSPSTDTWSGLGSGSNDAIHALALLANGNVVAAGFSTTGAVAADQIAVFDWTTNSWSALAVGIDNMVNGAALLPNEQLVVGGAFQTVGGVIANNVAIYNPMTGNWSPLASGTNGPVYAVAAFPDGDMAVGGYFDTAGGIAVNNIARYSPATNSWSDLGGGLTAPIDEQYDFVNPGVYALAVLSGGDLLVGGNFDSAGGIPVNNIARYSPATSSWSALGAGVTGTVLPSYYFLPGVYALAELPGGDVLVGGNFNTAGGGAIGYLARWSSSASTWSLPGYGPNYHVSALSVLPTGNVIVGGLFSYVGSSRASRVGLYNPTSNAWSAPAAGLAGGGYWGPRALAFAVLPDGDVIVGGDFDNAGTASSSNIARYSPATDAWEGLAAGVGAWPFGMGPTVSAAVAIPSGDVLAGGGFTIAGGGVSAFFARWSTRPSCPADFNCSGTVTFEDIFDYLAAWFAHSPSADFNHSGPPTVQDIFTFLAAWFAGCP